MVYNFSERIVELRKKRGWSQRDLARRIGKSASAVGTYETDTAVPSLEVASALADSFGVSLDYLLEGEKAQTLSLKKLSEKQTQLVTELVQEFSAPSGHGPEMSETQLQLLRRVIAEFVK